MSYNGWTNWETWNVAMWIGNDEMINRIMTLTAKGDWDLFKPLAMQFGITKTPDGVSFEDPKVNQGELRTSYKYDQNEREEEEEECSVLEGRRLLKSRSFYI
jgi:hypothetical protein